MGMIVKHCSAACLSNTVMHFETSLSSCPPRPPPNFSSLSGPVRRVPPRFSIPPADSEIMPGGNVNITCVAVGSPMPYVKWMLGAEDLTPEDDMPIGRNVLELTDVRQSNNYTCVAMSTLGVIEAVAQITVKGGVFVIIVMRLMGRTGRDVSQRGCDGLALPPVRLWFYLFIHLL